MFLLLSLLVSIVPLGGSSQPISCYNDNGEAVDWFYLYKLPKAHGSKSPTRGELYLFMDTGSMGWEDGKVTVNDSAGALGRTLGPMYAQGQNSELAYVLYNDQKPLKDDGGGRWKNMGASGGHTKGVVLLDKDQGFWLVHSTPHFPPIQRAGRYSYPESGRDNGQNFLCITFPLERFQTIGEQLQINQPYVYDCHVPEYLASRAPALAAVCGATPHLSARIVPHVKPPTNRSTTLTSRGGTHFISFAKGAAFHNDLYHSWVAPTLQSDLLVQFWIRSSGILPSDCSLGRKVLDITLLNPGPGSQAFKTSQDHSKWAASTGTDGPVAAWICVGDINRNKAEESRGGGTVCQQNPVVWTAYRTAAVQCEACGGGSVQC